MLACIEGLWRLYECAVRLERLHGCVTGFEHSLEGCILTKYSKFSRFYMYCGIVLVQPVFRQQFFKNSRNYEIWLLNENESTKSVLYNITIEIPLIKSQKFNLECMFNYHKKLESSNIFELLLSKHRLHQKDFNEHFKNVQLSSEELNMRPL